MRFEDREHAGRILASTLEYLRDARPVVLGLTHGSIPVAFEIARTLRAPLDMIVVRRGRAAVAPELSIGAIAEGGGTYLNPTYPHEIGLWEDWPAVLADDDAVGDLAGRIRLYRGEVRAPRLVGRTVVIVDDYAAAGTTARAAARAVRHRGAERIVFAAPVIAAAVQPELRREYDHVITLRITSPLRSPDDAYQRFEDVTEEAAIACLRRARTERLGEEVGTAARR